MPPSQGIYWIITLSVAIHPEQPKLADSPNLQWVKGQKEEGTNTGYIHWQFIVSLVKKSRLAAMVAIWPGCHAELTRSSAADIYVNKDDTKIAGTEFEEGVKKMKLNNKVDWANQLELAKHGSFDEMDPGVLMRCYNTCKKIRSDFSIAPDDAPSTTGIWIWGPPGVGKSRKARDDFPGIFDKACNKWWDGWKSTHRFALLDDFDKCHSGLGHHLKRWSDRYAFTAEEKGSSMNIRPEKIVVTSNYSIEEIFDDLTLVEALKRRFTIIHMTEAYGGLPLGPYDIENAE